MADITFARNSPFFVPAHCGKCAHADDGGIIGNAYTCALDGIDRYSAVDDCAHVEQFVETFKPLEERYPAYGKDHWSKAFRDARVQDMILSKSVESGKGKLVEIVGIGTAIIDGHPSVMAGVDGDEYHPVKHQYEEVTATNTRPLTPRDAA